MPRFFAVGTSAGDEGEIPSCSSSKCGTVASITYVSQDCVPEVVLLLARTILAAPTETE